MFEKQNRIIIVDDRQDELDTLSKAFLDNGIGCRPLLYENTYKDALSKIRIAFFDLNIGNKIVDDSGKTPEEIEKLNSGVYNDIAIALNQYIDKKNGPYALIFWTKNKKIIEGFIKYMQNPERGFANTPFPIFINCIDKDEFFENKENLSTKLLEVLNSEEIRFLFDFEDKARIAGEETINKIYEIIPKDNNWGESTILFDNLGKILSKIAASTLGFEHSKKYPCKAIYEGLIPILNSELSSMSSDIDWTRLLNPLYAATKYKELTSPDDSIQRKVNSVFHIEQSNSKKDVRGTVLLIEQSSSTILNTFDIADVNEWFSKILSIKDGRETLKTSILNATKLVAIEISAACDYSNNKQRINKYILGAMTPIIDIEKDVNLKGKIESSYHVGETNFHFENNDFQIWLNLNFVFGTNPNDERLGKPMFKLKKEIMDMIGNKYASHISRIGITSF